jgi:hypothetical protein
LAKVTGQRNHGANQTRPIPWSLHTGPFKPKSIVRLGDPISNRDLAYIKISLPEGNGAGFEVEAMNRAKVQDALRASACRAIRVPETYGRLHVGNTSYWMESAAPGMQLCRILRQAGYFADRERIASDLGQVFESLIELTNSLQTVRDAPVIDPGWYEIPEEFRNSGELRDALEKRRYFAHSLPHSGRTWVQHGDLSVENIAWDATTAQMTVFDWPDMAAGLPPLYDFFSFLCSFGYLPPREETVRFGSERERWTASFAAVFFSDAEFARLARKLMIGVCERLNVQPELIPALLLEFSIIRTHHYRTTSAVQRDIHLRLLELCLERNCSVLGFSASAA